MRSLKSCIVLCIVGFAGSAAATTVTFNPSKDAMIFATSGGSDTGNASGKGPGMFAGADNSSNMKRSLVHFDLTSLSTTATVDTVTLDLIVGQIAGSGGGGGGGSYTNRTIRLYTLTTAWNEGATGSPTPSGMSGTGQGWDYTSCNCNDTSWTYTNYSGSSWTSSGGDYNTPEDIATTFSSPFTIGMTNTFFGDLTSMPTVEPDFVAAVQAWVTTPSSNKGWMIISDLETSPTSFLGWWTIDGATANMNNALRPLLTIDYH